MRGPCVRARAPSGECVEWPFLRNLTSTFPSWKVLLVGQKQRPPSQRSSSVPRDRLIHVATLTNAVRPSLIPSVTPSVPLVLRVPPFCLVYLVLPPSQCGSCFRPIKTLYDHVVQHSVRRFIFLFFGSSHFFASSFSSFSFCFLSVVSSTCATFPSHDFIVPCSSLSFFLSLFLSISCSLYSFFSHYLSV